MSHAENLSFPRNRKSSDHQGVIQSRSTTAALFHFRFTDNQRLADCEVVGRPKFFPFAPPHPAASAPDRSFSESHLPADTNRREPALTLRFLCPRPSTAPAQLLDCRQPRLGGFDSGISLRWPGLLRRLGRWRLWTNLT